MAKAKKQETGELVLSTGALAHGQEAFGARYIKEGFGFTPRNDLEAALGFPHFFELAEGLAGDEDPAASAFAICSGSPETHVYGKLTAHRLVRGYAAGTAADMHGKPMPAFADATARTEPVTADEARSLVSACIRTDSVYDLDRLLLMAEALVGPDAVVAGALEGLGETPQEVVSGHSTNKGHLRGLIELGLMLLRLRPADRDAAIASWKALADRWKAASEKPRSPILDASAAVLRPTELVVGAGPLFQVDDPGAVVKWRAAFGNKPTKEDLPEARLVFLGGEEVYAMEVACWSKYTGSNASGSEQHAAIIERFGRIRSPSTVRLMLEMANKSKAKKPAQAWLSRHASHARPELERLSSGGLAEWAKAALAGM